MPVVSRARAVVPVVADVVPRPHRPTRLAALALALMIAGVLVVSGSARAQSATGDAANAGGTAKQELTLVQATVLGLVEGITEFLPISSTGHLTVVQDLLGVGEGESKTAADAYAIVIQAGAILAVVVLYWQRLLSIVRGAFGRDADGRRILVALLIAFVPGGALAFVFEGPIKDNLFGVGPVIVAWAVGGIVVLVLSARGWWDTSVDAEESHADKGNVGLEHIVVRQALIIGLAQALALWPGTSRSLVTIIAALAVGLELAAAVEFSFLLGFVTLGAATVYDGAKHGGEIVDQLGVRGPVVGFVVAFISAVAAIRWMVGYLQTRSLVIFGWYRLAAAGVALVLVATNVIQR